MKGVPSAHTVQAYVNALLESYFFYDIKRFDIKGKEYLRTLGKYDIVDMGLRNYLLGFRNRDSGHAIENVVYFELLRRGYDVAIGKVDQAEVDFIATKAENPGIGFRRSQGSFIYWWLCLCAQKLSSSAPLRCSRCRPATSHRCRCRMRHSRHRRRSCRWYSWNPEGSYKTARRRSIRWAWNRTSTP